jgi:hypothetical protein
MKNLHMLLLVSICGLFLVTIFLSVLGTVEWKKYKNNKHSKDDKSMPTWKKYIFAAIMCFILFFGLLAYLILNNHVVSKNYKFGGGKEEEEDDSHNKFDRPKRPWGGYWQNPTTLPKSDQPTPDLKPLDSQLYHNSAYYDLLRNSGSYDSSDRKPPYSSNSGSYNSLLSTSDPQKPLEVSFRNSASYDSQRAQLYPPFTPQPQPQVYVNNSSLNTPVVPKQQVLNKPKGKRLFHYTENPVRPLDNKYETSFMDREEVHPLKGKFMGRL